MVPFVACYLSLAVIHRRPGVTAPGLCYCAQQIDIAKTEKEKELKGEEKAEEKEIRKKL